MHHFFIISQLTTSIAIVYRPQYNSIQIILNALRLLLFFKILYGNISVVHLHDAMTLMHIYLISVSINRMLISQLIRFLSVKFMFSPQFNV